MLLLMDNNDIDRISKNFTLAFFDERLWDGSVFGGGCQELRPLYIERHRGVRRQILATAHEHWELTVVADGQMTLYADRGVETDAGTSVLIPPGLSHLEYSAKEVDTYWLGFQAELPGVPGDKAMEVVSEGLQKTRRGILELLKPMLQRGWRGAGWHDHDRGGGISSDA